MPEAINKHTGLKIVGTHEKVFGTAKVLPDSFEFRNGQIVDFDHEGYTAIDWDSQVTVKAASGDTVFIDEGGNEVPACDVVPEGTDLAGDEANAAEGSTDDERELLIAMVNRLLPEVPEGETKQAARDLLRSIWD